MQNDLNYTASGGICTYICKKELSAQYSMATTQVYSNPCISLTGMVLAAS